MNQDITKMVSRLVAQELILVFYYFVCFLGEFKDTKMSFPNLLTFKTGGFLMNRRGGRYTSFTHWAVITAHATSPFELDG